MAPSEPDGSAVRRLPMPSRNPLPLSSAQEAQVRETYHKRVRAYCADEIRLFAECATGRTFTTAFSCRSQHRDMNTCMVKYATPKEEDAAREEWFATRLQRQKEREAKELRKKEQEKFHKEWWGLPMDDNAPEAEPTVTKYTEKVGGFRRSGSDERKDSR